MIRRKQTSKGIESIPKLFVMPHGMLDPYFQKAAGRKFKAVRNWLYWKLIENNLIKQADGLLFTSMLELELASQSFVPYHPKNETVVGLGVDNPPWFEESNVCCNAMVRDQDLQNESIMN